MGGYNIENNYAENAMKLKEDIQKGDTSAMQELVLGLSPEDKVLALHIRVEMLKELKSAKQTYNGNEKDLEKILSLENMIVASYATLGNLGEAAPTYDKSNEFSMQFALDFLKESVPDKYGVTQENINSAIKQVEHELKIFNNSDLDKYIEKTEKDFKSVIKNVPADSLKILELDKNPTILGDNQVVEDMNKEHDDIRQV